MANQNNKPTTPSYQSLDDMLEHFIKMRVNGKMYYNEFIEQPFFTNYTSQMIKAMLNKLISDGYINTDDRSGVTQINKIMISISLEGILFNDNGGYVGEQKRIKKNTMLKSVQTWAIATGTFLAALYSILSYYRTYEFNFYIFSIILLALFILIIKLINI
jgi:hypothetical protein